MASIEELTNGADKGRVIQLGNRTNDLNVLITTSGRKAALVKAFQKAIKESGVSGKVIATDASREAVTMHISDAAYLVPRVDDPGYVPALLEICRQEGVKLLIPLYEPEFYMLDQQRDEFTKVGVCLLLSTKQVLETCGDKYATYKFLMKTGIPTVRTYLPEELPEKAALNFPMFIKPRTGMGSVGAYRVNNEKELNFFLDYVPNPVVQDYLEGTEFTMDVLSDLGGQVLAVVPRERIEVRAGEVSKSRTVDRPDIIESTVAIAEKLGIAGPSTIQCFATEQGIVFTEINPRFGGGVSLAFAAGADYPSALLKMAIGEEVRPFIGQYRKGLLMLRYDEALYLDNLGEKHD